jgi:hypothetical protein
VLNYVGKADTLTGHYDPNGALDIAPHPDRAHANLADALDYWSRISMHQSAPVYFNRLLLLANISSASASDK